MPRRITLQLNKESLTTAIKEVNDYKKDVVSAINKLCEALVREGEQIARDKIKFHGAIQTGQLHDSVQGAFDPTTGIGFIMVHAYDSEYGYDYAQIIEFGSGLRGPQGSSPDRPAGWEYNIHHYGDNTGWFYKGENGDWIRTFGQAPRPFMWETYLELLEKAKGIAKVTYDPQPTFYGSRVDAKYEEWIESVGLID